MDGTDAQGTPLWPELEELARPARERRRLPPETRSDIIVRLCSKAALSVKELSLLLDRSEAYVGDAIRPLVNDGSLIFMYPDQPRHPRQKYVAARTTARPARTARPSVQLVRDELLEPDDVAPRFPNLWSNVAYVIVVGLILALSHAPVWLLFAVAAGAGLAWWHVSAESEQYRRFQQLLPRRTKPTQFMLLKSAVTVIEIAIVYLVTAGTF